MSRSTRSPFFSVAIGIGLLVLSAWVAIVPTSTPTQAATRPMGLPDLSILIEAALVLAQNAPDVAAQAPATPIAHPPAAAVPGLSGGLDSVLVNLGGWAAILWGLANKLINRVDLRIAAIEKRLGTLSNDIRNMIREMKAMRRLHVTPAIPPHPPAPPNHAPDQH